jgi:hypothetical protein
MTSLIHRRNQLRQNLHRGIVSASLAAIGALAFDPAAGSAQESAALIDALVRKGVLTDREAEDIRTDINKDLANTSAGKIKLSNSITDLKLYGDLRLRYQYNQFDRQLDPPEVGAAKPGNGDKDRSPSGEPQSRWRFRLRLNADFKLGRDWFGGVELSTAQASDSGNQTYENGFDDYNIYISKAYLGWNAADWLTVTAGKVPNPFYSNDGLVWDADINPTGLTQSFALHKLFALTSESGGGYAKDGKASIPIEKKSSPWEINLVAGQFIFDDNSENAFDNDSATDAYLFETQLVTSYRFGKDVKLLVAPAWFTYVNGSLGGLSNAAAFNDNADVSGATRNLNLLLLPGELAFKAAGIKTRLYWDFSYNIEGRKRVNDIYDVFTLNNNLGQRSDNDVTDPDDKSFGHSPQDDYAYLVGIQLGENRKKGDWSVLANWRQTGLGAVDPNLNDSDFANSFLNTRGLKFSFAYSFTDFAVLALTYQHAWNLRDTLVGGQATGGNAIANANEVQTVQVDFNLKF